ncbi:MAG: HAD family phosphatase [Eubacteriales bacterium]
MKRDISTYSAAIFDMDGTLVDSMSMWSDIDREYLEKYGIPMPPDLQKAIDPLTWEECELYFRDVLGIHKEPAEIGREWLDMAMQKYEHEVALKPGVKEILAYLKRNGTAIGVASSSSRAMIEGALGAHDILRYFDTIVSCDEAGAGKPDPACYLAAAEKLGKKPASCVVFEDLPNGIRAGLRAGMTVIAVDDAYSRPMEEEKRTLAAGFIRDFRELIPE